MQQWSGSWSGRGEGRFSAGKVQGGTGGTKGLTEVRGITSREGPGGLEIGAGSVIAGGLPPPTTCTARFCAQVYPRAGGLLDGRAGLFTEAGFVVDYNFLMYAGVKSGLFLRNGTGAPPPDLYTAFFVIRVGTQGNQGAMAPYDPTSGSTPRSAGNYKVPPDFRPPSFNLYRDLRTYSLRKEAKLCKAGYLLVYGIHQKSTLSPYCSLFFLMKPHREPGPQAREFFQQSFDGTRGKAGQRNLWRYRALQGGYYQHLSIFPITRSIIL